MSGNHTALLLEDMNAKLDAILEGQANAPLLARINLMDERLERVESDVTVIKAVLTDHSRVLNEHGKMLNEHGKMLNEHGRMLNEHGRMLNEHGQRLGRLEQALV